MKTQYEQQLNAAALKSMGVPVVKSLKQKHHEVILDWINNGKVIPVDYQNNTQQVLDLLFKNHAPKELKIA
jgi:RIO-like serine/threonine protein kinase